MANLRKTRISATYKESYDKIMTNLGFFVNRAQCSFTRRKGTRTLRIWRARERERIMRTWGGAPSGVQGQSPWSGGHGGEAPLKLKAF